MACSSQATDEPDASTDRPDYRQQLIDLCADAQPEGENGWPHLMEAVQRMEQVLAGYPLPDFERRDDWDDGQPDFWRILAPIEDQSDDVTLELRALEQMEEAGVFTLIDRAARCPRFVRPIPEDQLLALSEASTAYASSMRTMTRTLRASVHLAAEEREKGQLVSGFERASTIGRAASHQPSAIEWLSGGALSRGAIMQIREMIADGRLMPEAFPTLLDLLRQHQIGSLARACEAERLRLLDIVDRTYSLDDSGDGTIDPEAMRALSLGFGSEPEDRGSGFGFKPEDRASGSDTPGLFATRREMVGRINDFYKPFIEAARRSRYERPPLPFDEDTFVNNLGTRYAYLRIMLPSVGKMIDQMDEYQAIKIGTQTMLALEIHRAREGSYPETLAVLTPDILSAVPLDPFDGRPLRYRLLEDDAFGREYELYTVGMDGKDDNGTYNLEYPQNALGDCNAEGLDYPFNLPSDVIED
ncbi:MAG: hypothetical protein SYC29_12055 [Planctomycetota bacterium]|nr:hypothetical protein [Planctomycetota bacterium]